MGLSHLVLLTSILMVALMVESLGNDEDPKMLRRLSCLPTKNNRSISQVLQEVCKWPCYSYARRSPESSLSIHAYEPISSSHIEAEAASGTGRRKVSSHKIPPSLQRKPKKERSADISDAVESWQQSNIVWSLQRLNHNTSQKSGSLILLCFLFFVLIHYVTFYMLISMYNVKKCFDVPDDDTTTQNDTFSSIYDKRGSKTFRSKLALAGLETDINSMRNFRDSKKDYRFFLSQTPYIPKEMDPVTVYTLTHNMACTLRLASFRSFPQRSEVQSSIPFSTLVDAGFRYNGAGLNVECDGCKSSHDIHSVYQNPFAQNFHSVGCQFVEPTGVSEGSTAELVNEDIDSGFSESIGTDGECGDSNPPSLHIDSEGDKENDTRSSVPISTLQSQPPEPCRIIDNAAHPNTHGTFPSTTRTSSSTNNSNNTSSTTNSSNNVITNSNAASHTTTVGVNNVSNSSHDGASAASNKNGRTSNTTDNLATSSMNEEPSAIFIDGNTLMKDSELEDKNFYGSELCLSEHAFERQKPFRVEGAKRESCVKNPGHFSYYSLAEQRLDRLPEFTRCSEFLELLYLLSDLTVRIVVGCRSSAREKIQGADVGSEKYRTGTGSVIREPLFDVVDQEIKSEKTSSGGSKHSKLKSLGGAMRNRYKSLRSKHKPAANYVFVETNRHIVFDDKEAEHTTVEFYFNHVSRRGVVQIKGSHILHDRSVDGGERSFLVCHVSDKAFVETLREKREKLDELVNGLPSKVREALHKRVLILHHPHGAEKVYSFGEYVINRYLIKREPLASSSPQAKLEKLKGFNQNPSDLKKLRKILFYVAETCTGSSGAPVIMFKPTGTDSEGGPTVAINLWMHSGRESQGALNMSALEGCTEKDLAPPPVLYTPKPEPKPLPQPGPVVRMGNPYYPAYSLTQKRLESFNDAPGPFVHTPHELAKAGFFWAGYIDCVRCYYCGVGLRNWKVGDDIYVEHERVRPDCHFLILQLRVIGATPIGEAAAAVTASSSTSLSSGGDGVNNATASGIDSTSSNTDLTGLSPAQLEYSRQLRLRLQLAQTENALLQRPFICKVCNNKPVQPLYLPCGHLDSCEDCTARLSHCPTCRTKILATVKVFFA